MIAVVDYRAGNLTSVVAALEKLGHAGRVTCSPREIAEADRIVFPGVGAAGDAMSHLRELGLVDAIRAAVAAGKPFLGICLGYQILFEYSDEDGGVDCLGLLRGGVVRFSDNLRDPQSGRCLKVPQMGWNRAAFRGVHPLWADITDDSEFYFVHSYYPVPAADQVCALTDYGIEFASGAMHGNLAAFQFHPEKSGRPGLKLLDNFCRWRP